MNSNASDPPDDVVTPPSVYFSRRSFLRAGILGASVVGTGLIYRRLNDVNSATPQTPKLAGLETFATTGPTTGPAAESTAGFRTDEPMTSLQAITHYNNYYEFSTDKDGVAGPAADFKTAGWKVEVGGLCSKPRTFDLDDIMKVSRPQERVYRMRCVEAWSMVIPWDGLLDLQAARRG